MRTLNTFVLILAWSIGCVTHKNELTDDVDGESGFEYEDYPDYTVLYYCAAYAENACIRVREECQTYWTAFDPEAEFDWQNFVCIPTYMEDCAVLVAAAPDTEAAVEALRLACASGMDYATYEERSNDPLITCETYMDPETQALRQTTEELCPCAATGDVYYSGSFYTCG